MSRPDEENPLICQIPVEADVRRLCAEFRLDELARIHGDLGGSFNVNLMIETFGGCFILRIHSGLASEAHLLYQEHVLSLIPHLPAVRPLTSAKGVKHSTYHGRIVQALPFIAGKGFEDRPSQLRTSGETLARIHQALRNAPSGPLPTWSNYPSDGVLEEGLRKFDESARAVDRADVRRIRHQHERVMERWYAADRTLPQTVIHGDWHPGNLVYDDNDAVKGILDFDFV